MIGVEPGWLGRPCVQHPSSQRTYKGCGEKTDNAFSLASLHGFESVLSRACRPPFQIHLVSLLVPWPSVPGSVTPEVALGEDAIPLYFSSLFVGFTGTALSSPPVEN